MNTTDMLTDRDWCKTFQNK